MSIARFLGFDTAAERYAYANDPVMGYTSAGKIPDRWVSTTCGYCSVGCGMFIGVKDGRAVSVRGDPDHPVNRGALCPKGLSEHEMIHVASRAQISAPASDPEEPPRACQLGCRAADDGPQVPGSAGGVWPGGGWRHQYRAARHGGVLRSRQAGAARSRHTALRRQHHAVHVHGGGRLQTLVRHGRAAWGVRGPRTGRCHPAHRRQHRRQPPDSLAASRGQPRQDTDRRRPSGQQDRHAGRPPSTAQAALGSRAHQRPHPHRHSPRVDQA